MIISNEEKEIISLFNNEKYEEFEFALRKYLEDKDTTDEVRQFFDYVCLLEHKSNDYYTSYAAHADMDTSKKAESRFTEIVEDREIYQKYKNMSFDNDFLSSVKVARIYFKQHNYGLMKNELNKIFEVINNEQDVEKFLQLYKTFIFNFKEINGTLISAAMYLGKVLKDNVRFNTFD
ncbi:hypothetical protein D3C71_1714810 [compost metagenome]